MGAVTQPARQQEPGHNFFVTFQPFWCSLGSTRGARQQRQPHKTRTCLIPQAPHHLHPSSPD